MIFRRLHQIILRIMIKDIDAAMDEEMRRIDEWPLRRNVWLQERARLWSKLDRSRGARELVNHQFRGKA